VYSMTKACSYACPHCYQRHDHGPDLEEDLLLGTARAVVDAGGDVLAQDAATSIVWGMPGEVAKAGLAQMVLPLTRIGPEIAARLKCAAT